MANFPNVNPLSLTEYEWADFFNKAVWLEGWRLKNQADMLVHVFGGGKKTTKKKRRR